MRLQQACYRLKADNSYRYRSYKFETKTIRLNP
jgi:hypothetical protein